jgi:hypothetical protein
MHACLVGQIRTIFPHVPPRQEGRIATVTTREVGCDGLSVLQHAVSRADEQYVQDGEVVWFWHPGADAVPMRKRRAQTGARKPVPGEITYKP